MIVVSRPSSRFGPVVSRDFWKINAAPGNNNRSGSPHFAKSSFHIFCVSYKWTQGLEIAVEKGTLNKGKRLISTTRHCECAILAACLFNGKKERFDLFVHASLHAPPRKYFLFDLCLCSLKEKKSLRLFLYDDEGRIELAPPKKYVKDARQLYDTKLSMVYT